MKIKIFNSRVETEIEDEVNEFLKTHTAIDIRLSETNYSWTILILYKEGDK